TGYEAGQGGHPGPDGDGLAPSPARPGDDRVDARSPDDPAPGRESQWNREPSHASGTPRRQIGETLEGMASRLAEPLVFQALRRVESGTTRSGISQDHGDSNASHATPIGYTGTADRHHRSGHSLVRPMATRGGHREST